MRNPQNRILALVVLAISSTAFAAGSTDDLACNNALESQAARFSGMMTKDVAILDELLAEDLSYGHTRGWIESKASFLSTIESGVIEYINISPSNLICRIAGDTAILTGESAMKLIVRGQPVDFSIKFLEVAYQAAGRWQLLAWQSVRLPDDGEE